MAPSNASGKVLEAGWFQDRPRMSVGKCSGGYFGATWVILGSILDPVGRQGDPNITQFSINFVQHVKKMFLRLGARKNSIY